MSSEGNEAGFATGAQTLGKRKLQQSQQAAKVPTNVHLGVDLDHVHILPNNNLEYDAKHLEELMLDGKANTRFIDW